MLFDSLIRFVELRGLQAAGKTMLARQWVKEYPNVARINRDDLRNMLFGESYELKQEPVVLACELACAEACTVLGHSVVIDDTNLTGSDVWEMLAEHLGIPHRVYHVPVSVEEAIRRDALRPNPVGAVAIRTTAARARRSNRL